MIKITNYQASAFNTPIITHLLTDETRRFPVSAAFMLSDIVHSIQGRLNAYNQVIRDIVKSNGGIIDEKGNVTYQTDEGQQTAQEEIEEVNAIEFEVPGQFLTPDDSWPKLTIAEASILRPLLKNGKR